ncbi:MAG: hypothetical protein A2075_11670 [Geobacteraceae bacterium GWC2_58_44]|nr:MAG: hypothetical protein A2075_11670 [Geobacteraceae bacterium GWC2_58_44]
MALALTGCGGGAGSAAGNGTNGLNNTTIDTVITGTASKGPITGTISFYALDGDGAKVSLLKEAPIVNGNYSANIGKYAGPIVIEVTGSYTDEATGQPLTITAGAPIRAAHSNASGNITVAVTPLTELAVRNAGVLTAPAIDAGNKLISDIFQFDIVKTQPVAPLAAAVNLAADKQKEYTLAIAALSQLSLRMSEPLSNTLTRVAGGISSVGMSSQTVADFQDALTRFMTNPNNRTEIHDLSATNLAALTGSIASTATFTLAIQGPVAAKTIKGIQFDLVIPDGLTIRSDAATGTPLSGIVTLSTAAAAASPELFSTYSDSSSVLGIGLLSNTGIGTGDLVTITCDIKPGWSVPSATAFSVTNINAVDIKSDGSTVVLGDVTVQVK